MKYTRNVIYITLILILFFSVSIGYAFLSTTLTIDSNVTIKKKNCNVVKNLYKSFVPPFSVVLIIFQQYPAKFTLLLVTFPL